MKLICESITDVKIIKESTESGKKDLFIEGPFLMGDKPNRNGRIYESRVLAKEVARYNENYIKHNRAYGELGNPDGPGINLDRVSHLITRLEQDGSNFVGRAKITETPMGNIARGILESGGTLGVSSRGLGTLTKNREGFMMVGDDFQLATAADIVADPSAHIAFVEAITENVNWVFDNGNWKAVQAAEEIQKEIKTMTRRQVTESQMVMFERYINSLVSK